MAADALTTHRDVYDKFLKYQQEGPRLLMELEAARQGAIEHLAKKLGQESGVAVSSSEDPDPDPVNGMPMPARARDGDPLHAFVLAAESNYARWLGPDRPQLPLAIHIMNNHTLLDLDCPHCGKPIASTTPKPLPAGSELVPR